MAHRTALPRTQCPKTTRDDGRGRGSTHHGTGSEVPGDDGPEPQAGADLEDGSPCQRDVLGARRAAHEPAEGDRRPPGGSSGALDVHEVLPEHDWRSARDTTNVRHGQPAWLDRSSTTPTAQPTLTKSTRAHIPGVARLGQRITGNPHNISDGCFLLPAPTPRLGKQVSIKHGLAGGKGDILDDSDRRESVAPNQEPERGNTVQWRSRD